MAEEDVAHLVLGWTRRELLVHGDVGFHAIPCRSVAVIVARL